MIVDYEVQRYELTENLAEIISVSIKDFSGFRRAFARSEIEAFTDRDEIAYNERNLYSTVCHLLRGCLIDFVLNDDVPV